MDFSFLKDCANKKNAAIPHLWKQRQQSHLNTTEKKTAHPHVISRTQSRVNARFRPRSRVIQPVATASSPPPDTLSLYRPIDKVFFDSDYLVDKPFSDKDHCFILQNKYEFSRLISRIEALPIRDSIIEVGFCYGGSCLVWQKLFKHIVTIDIVPEVFDCFSAIFGKEANTEFIVGNSTSESVLNRLDQIGKADVVFLDGDHSYQQIRDEYMKYSRLVKPGGLLVMHDVWDGTYVEQFTRDLLAGTIDGRKHDLELIGGSDTPGWRKLGIGIEIIT